MSEHAPGSDARGGPRQKEESEIRPVGRGRRLGSRPSCSVCCMCLCVSLCDGRDMDTRRPSVWPPRTLPAQLVWGGMLRAVAAVVVLRIGRTSSAPLHASDQHAACKHAYECLGRRARLRGARGSPGRRLLGWLAPPSSRLVRRKIVRPPLGRWRHSFARGRGCLPAPCTMSGTVCILCV